MSVGHLAEELDAYQTHLQLVKVVAEVLHYNIQCI
jgi:hypothetical protein